MPPSNNAILSDKMGDGVRLMTVPSASSPSRTIPGPPTIPFMGGRATLLGLYRNPFAYMRRLFESYGPVVAAARGDPSIVFAFGPELNHRLLSEPDLFLAGKMALLPLPEGTALKRLFQNNLPSMNGARHRQQRRLMQPAFHRQQTERYCREMVALTAQMLDEWSCHRTFDLHAEMRQLTQRIAVKTLFGVYDEKEVDHVGLLLRQLIDLTSSPLFLLAPFNLPGLLFRRANHLAGELEAYVRSVVLRRRATPDESAVLSALVHARDEESGQLTDEELVGHAFTLFVAGHETTSNALVWTLFLLHQHHRVAVDLLDELEGALGGAAPTVEELGTLPLLDGVVRESLRLLPPAPLGIRTAAAPCVLGGYALPQGANVFYSEFITHRLLELYDEPECFRPERWRSLERTAYEYLPFGAGPHMCIGWAFAMQELKVVLAMLHPRYRLSIAEHSRVDLTLHMRLRGGMPVQVHPQDRRFKAVPVGGRISDLVETVGTGSAARNGAGLPV